MIEFETYPVQHREERERGEDQMRPACGECSNKEELNSDRSYFEGMSMPAWHTSSIHRRLYSPLWADALEASKQQQQQRQVILDPTARRLGHTRLETCDIWEGQKGGLSPICWKPMMSGAGQ